MLSSSSDDMPKEKVAVLGAGPMGLAVAYQLAVDGFAPVVYEADDRIGGMAAMFEFGDVNIERYYHFHCTSDDDAFSLAREIGVEHEVSWRTTSMGVWNGSELQPWGDPLSLLRFRGIGLISKLRYGFHAYVSVRRTRWKRLDRIDAATWIRRWVGKRAFDLLWKDLFDYKFYDLANNVSAAWIWHRIHRLGRSRSSIFKERLGYFRGGSSTLLDSIAQRIVQLGGEIRLGHPVERIITREGRVVGVVADGQAEDVTRVISTVPVPLVPGLVPELPQEVIDKYRSIVSIPVICVILKLAKPVTAHFWVNTHDADFDIPGFVEMTNLREDLGDHIVYVPFYLPADHPTFTDSDETFVNKVLGYFTKINPALNHSDLLDYRVHRYRHAQPICSPGHLDRLPSIVSPIEGLLIADTNYYYPEDRGISQSIRLGRELATMCREHT